MLFQKFVHFGVANKDLHNSSTCGQFQTKLLKQEVSKTKFEEKNINFDANSIVTILDVGSHFTNILLDKTVENVINVLLSNNDKVRRLIKNDLKNFHKFSCCELFLILNFTNFLALSCF